MTTDHLATLFWLLVAHSMCDYPLQGDFMARAKNPANPMSGVPWLTVMMAHCLIHAGGVALVTGSVAAGVFEFAAHLMIDTAKCRGRIGFATDQAMHAACKVFIACWFAYGA